jgi:site-specific DNA recombinase
VVIVNKETGSGLRGVSAFKRRRIPLPDGRIELRTVRPGFRRALAMLADGLIALDLDRAMRDPRDLEDLIDLVEQSSPRIPVEPVRDRCAWPMTPT